MKVLILGGENFLAGHIEARWREEGAETWTLSYADCLPGGAGAIRKGPGIARSHSFDLVCFLIAKPHHSSGPVGAMTVNSAGLERALAAAREGGARFCLAAGSGVYGAAAGDRPEEGHWGRVDPLGPDGPDGESARFAEALTAAYSRKHGADVRIARIFGAYGPGMVEEDDPLIVSCVQRALKGDALELPGDGRATVCRCYASDVAEGVRRIVLKGDGMPYNLGDPQEYTMGGLARTVVNYCGSSGELRFLPGANPGVPARPNIARINQKLGWAPLVPLEEGLRRTIEDFRRRMEGRPSS